MIAFLKYSTLAAYAFCSAKATQTEQPKQKDNDASTETTERQYKPPPLESRVRGSQCAGAEVTAAKSSSGRSGSFSLAPENNDNTMYTTAVPNQTGMTRKNKCIHSPMNAA